MSRAARIFLSKLRTTPAHRIEIYTQLLLKRYQLQYTPAAPSGSRSALSRKCDGAGHWPAAHQNQLETVRRVWDRYDGRDLGSLGRMPSLRISMVTANGRGVSVRQLLGIHARERQRRLRSANTLPRPCTMPITRTRLPSITNADGKPNCSFRMRTIIGPYFSSRAAISTSRHLHPVDCDHRQRRRDLGG